jgi:hypothetical protein
MTPNTAEPWSYEPTQSSLPCPFCQGTGSVRPDVNWENLFSRLGLVYEPGCSSTFDFGRSGKVHLNVQGKNADEVERVAHNLAKLMHQQQEARKLKSPWFSGIFYVAALVVVGAVLLVLGRYLSAWVLPFAVVGAALLLMVVGALQMRQDDQLSERGFLKLMGDVLARLPMLLRRQAGRS